MDEENNWPAKKYHSYVPEIVAGTVSALVLVALSGSFGLLIFNGQLTPFASFGITISLISAALIGGWVSLRSDYRGVIAIPQDRIAPVLGFMSASIMSIMQTRPQEEMVGTVIAAIALTSIITGMVLYTLGRLRLGDLIRSIPYPVIGGFLAGSGWLLCAGSIKVMTGESFTLADPLRLYRSGDIHLWLPCAGFGLTIFVLSLRVRHWSVLPGCIISGIVLFYLWLEFLSGASFELAQYYKWVMVSLGEQQAMDWRALQTIVHADPGVLISQWGTVVAVAITALVSILLNSSALEIETRQEADLNDELRHSGIGNIAAGLGGGMVGFTSLSLSRLNREMGGRTRLSGLVMALICGGFFITGTSFIAYIPKYILGGLLFYLGLRFLHEWVIKTFHRLPRTDYAIVILILVVISTAGYVEGVIAGTISAALLFVIKYSRVDVISQQLCGAQVHSHVNRSLAQEKFLHQRGNRILLLELQGFIFFGSANSLITEVQQRLARQDTEPLEHLILNFRRVHGLDTSAVIALNKLKVLSERNHFILIMSSLSPHLTTQMNRAGFSTNASPSFQQHMDRDHALEWCEDELLQQENKMGLSDQQTLAEQLSAFWPVDELPVDSMLPYLTLQKIDAGTYLIKQGEDSDGLFFINRGNVVAQIELNTGETTRLRSMGAGTVVGELGLYLNQPRTASIVSSEPCIVYRLTRSDLQRMQKDDPAVASAFHHFMTCLLAERMTATNRTLQSALE
jgi:SulP family sulfate permease